MQLYVSRMSEISTFKQSLLFKLLSEAEIKHIRKRSGSVVENLTQDRRAVGSSLTGVTALWSLSKTHLS